MKSVLYFLILIWSTAAIHGKDPSDTRRSGQSDPDAVKSILPPSTVFSESIRELVAAVNSSARLEALAKLHRIDSDLLVNDPEHWRPLFLEELSDLDPGTIGEFEDGLVQRYVRLMDEPERLHKSNSNELGMIAVVGKRAMSAKLAKLFLRDASKVSPYRFKDRIEPGGWRPVDEDDWKGLQGRLVSASIASDSEQILREWITLADRSTGDFRLLILWALGYSLREEAVTYLLDQRTKGLSERDNLIVAYASCFIQQRTSQLLEALPKYAGGKFGVLTSAEVGVLATRLSKSVPRIKQQLKNAGISIASPLLMYRD